MRKFIVVLLAVLSSVVTNGTASAGERAEAFTLSPLVGGTTFDGDERLETRPTFGLRLGYDFSKNWAAELTSNYTGTVPKNGNALIDIVNYRLEGVYNFMPDTPLVPYLAVGGGGQTILLAEHDKTYATANIGAGIKYFFTEDMAFRADYHTNFIVNQEAIDRDVRHDYLVNYEYTFGLQILFGGRK